MSNYKPIKTFENQNKTREAIVVLIDGTKYGVSTKNDFGVHFFSQFDENADAAMHFAEQWVNKYE